MSIFGKKNQISRTSFRERLRRAPSRLPGTAGRKYSIKERVKMEKELFGPKFGGHISREEYQKKLKKLTRERLKCKSLDEKRTAERKIRYLRKLGGM